MICPKCRKNHAHRSPRSGFRDRAAHWLFLKPYVCADCDKRFYAYPGGGRGPTVRMEAEMRMWELRRTKSWRTFRRNWLGFAIAAVLFAVALYVLAVQRPGAG